MSKLNDVDLEHLETLDASQLVRFALETFGERAAIGTSLQKTGIVMIDLAHRLEIPYRVFFVDTLKNNPETLELLEEVEDHYRIKIERYAPTAEEVHALYLEFGMYANYYARTVCCHTRKTLPLHRAMETFDAWMSGLRADQSEHRRQKGRKAAWAYSPDGRRLLKLNPLYEWTGEDIDAYTRDNRLPYNKLYDYVSPYGERYTIIGCACCHIPIMPSFDSRAGKFPWEQGAKECGLHKDGSGI